MSSSTEKQTPVRSRVGDVQLALRLWPVLLAAVVSLLPFTAFSTLVVPISAAVGADEGQVSGLRGLGGLGAVLVAVAVGPVLGGWPQRRTTAVGMLVLAAAAALGAAGSMPALVVMCLTLGAATAVITPVLLTTATELAPGHDHARARAAVLVTATQTLTAVLAAPLLALAADPLGWQGALLVSALLAVLAAVVLLRRRPAGGTIDGATPLGYRQAVVALRRRPDLLALIGIAGLRTTSFMGYLAFLAASYHDRFGLDPARIALVWALSGLCFVVGNYLTGRAAGLWADRARSALLVTLAIAGAAVVIVFVTDRLAVAVFATMLLGTAHAAVAAIVTSAIAQRAGNLTTSAYALNGAGMSLGVLCGGVLGAAGLAIGGAAGLGAALAVPVVLGLIVASTARAFRPHRRVR